MKLQEISIIKSVMWLIHSTMTHWAPTMYEKLRKLQCTEQTKSLYSCNLRSNMCGRGETPMEKQVISKKTYIMLGGDMCCREKK